MTYLLADSVQFDDNHGFSDVFVKYFTKFSRKRSTIVLHWWRGICGMS